MTSLDTQPSVPTRHTLDASPRTPAAVVNPVFLQRVSSRAFQTAPLPAALVRSLFEAARWSPSAANTQPWLFLIADTEPTLTLFRSLLNEQNRRWADSAPLLTIVLTKKHRDGKPSRTAEFDAGAAWMSLSLQATLLGLRTRAMGGSSSTLCTSNCTFRALTTKCWLQSLLDFPPTQRHYRLI